MKRRTVWAAALAALLVLGVPGVRAEFTSWSYSWSLPAGVGPTFSSESGFTNVALALTPGTKPGASSIPVGTFSGNTTASEEAFDASYLLGLKITDNTTGDSGTLTFHGRLTGSLAGGLGNGFSDPSQTLTLDGHAYHVSLDPATDVPGPHRPAAPLNARVSVADVQGTGGQPGPVPQVPEPTALALAGTGLCLVACWRRAASQRRWDGCPT
jgi:hypothetical protein